MRKNQCTCIICEAATQPLQWLCEQCGSSYDRNGGGDGSVMVAMEWAAARARYFAKRKKKDSP